MSIKHFSPESVSERRLEAVRQRLDGVTVAEAARRTGLSAPTVTAAWKAFCQGGWAAVPVRERGRRQGQAPRLTPLVQQALWRRLESPPPADEPGWTSAALAADVGAERGVALTRRSVEHWWEDEGLKISPWPLEQWGAERSSRGRWFRQTVAPVWQRLPRATQRWQGGARRVRHPQRPVYQLYFHGPRGRLWMRCLPHPPRADDYLLAFEALAQNGPAGLVFHGADLAASPEIQAWLAEQPEFYVFRLRGSE
ncbi:helix-turn-helix domain-containing protein [Halomonas piscis]|uniref:helix-turn-helix domain-containing protein n=1 Tax=Halomonas piscis TaxID=3031727 RepID=UPI0028998E61|nr:helix-turn-helix domain-containing protein [Halomonas piscis]